MTTSYTCICFIPVCVCVCVSLSNVLTSAFSNISALWWRVHYVFCQLREPRRTETWIELLPKLKPSRTDPSVPNHRSERKVYPRPYIPSSEILLTWCLVPVTLKEMYLKLNRKFYNICISNTSVGQHVNYCFSNMFRLIILAILKER
jgi:hypothetical protein